MFKLVIQDDEGKTTVVPLIRDEITIGRKEGNTIRLTERNVSRRHARILRNNGEVQIEDLGSYNGIRVNNARIAERVSLRVSDQVQIGDYKLYLKAEGVEQIDDARTQPVERVDNAPTDVMAAVATQATQPISVAPTPAPGTPGKLVGNPNQTMVSLPDPDPGGRPVATPAVLNALATPVGYGKLVVLSSNFAGKEFELSRPQMIIGRTDENDIVVNHRSISRNHAKLVREPETGRYTISDLQSSNGVRVNGQDYGKVELRRGDVIDLGHVRLRFVEPGEDFVFARDAVITDVPEAGGRGRLILAIVLGVIVLGVIGAIVVMRSNSGTGGGSGSGKELGGGAGTASGGVEPADAPQMASTTPDATEETPLPAVPDAQIPTPQVGASEIEVECLRYQSDQKWDDLDACADRLKAVSPAAARKLKERAVLETKAVPRINAFEAALRDKNLKKAEAEIRQLANVTSYSKLKQRYEAAEDAAVRELVEKLKAARDADCRQYNQLLAQERTSKPSSVAAEAARQVRCTERVTTPTPPTPPAGCDPDAFVEKGREFNANGQALAALDAFDKAWACKPDPSIAEKAFIPACNLGNAAKAKLYWKRMSALMRQRAIGICVRNGISEETLNGQ
ncbi:MAG TPA: FHA domain-containing protein [Kofleriaceae bacterium]|nr:FHA domain-containing protein [Kofleriaceae bacterium]